ncbi:MAG: hypothetical protein PHF00_10015, partial [Elusimicrobia bacterium]|nr:hypothetical protein [Elusimicrobiota bacterium]
VEPGHDLGKITGTDIEMSVGDHAFGGAINGAVAFGFFDEGKGARLLLRKYGQLIETQFKKQEDGSYGGVIKSVDGTAERATPVFAKGMVPGAPKPTFNLQIGKEVVSVTMVENEGMVGAHYKNPTFEAVIAGKTVRYRIQVECCLGYSLNMAMMILGAHAH